MSSWYSLHIKNEILFWFLFLALLPLMVLSFSNYFFQKNIYEQNAKEHLKLILDQKIENVESHISLLETEIKILANTPIIKEAIDKFDTQYTLLGKTKNIKKYDEYFTQIVNESDLYDLFLINNFGDIVYTQKKESDIGTNLKTGLYSYTNLAKVYNNVNSILQIRISDFEFYRPSNSQAAFMAVPIFGENKIIGTLAIQINIDKIYKLFSNNNGLGNSGEFYAAKKGKDSKIVAATKLKYIDEKSEYIFKQDTNLPIIKAINGDKNSKITTDYRGKTVVASWSYIPTLRWGAVAKIDLDEILQPINNLRFYSIIILFFVTIGIVAVIYVVLKHIVEPIEHLTNRVKRFASGDIKEQTTIEVDNEIGELSRNFNDMAKSLKSSQATIQKYANELELKVDQRTKQLQNTKDSLINTNKKMQSYFDILNRYVITSTTNPDGVIINVSGAFCQITGYSKEELIGKKHNIIRHPDMESSLYKELWESITNGKIWTGEIKNQRKDGTFYWVKATITPVFDEFGNIKEYTSIREDITDKKLVEKLSITDRLTQLYNRVKLDDVFKDEINRAKRYDEKFCVILLDIDHFKSVNDTYGHDVGDMTLIDVANILKSSIRQTDIVGRWGGEEFVIITPKTTLENAMILANKIRENIQNHTFKHIGTKTSSFGVSIYKDGDNADTMVKRADNALYEAKKTGRNKVVTLEDLKG